MTAEARPARWRTWLQLLRAPNLFTVPGDPLVGGLVASSGFIGWPLGLAVFASLCLYAAGLLTNDLADLEEDRRDRPARPLPSGAADRSTVEIVAIALALAGLVALWVSHHRAAFECGVALAGAILLYNRVTKRVPVLGALNMGLCRGLSVMLGALMAPGYGLPMAIPVAMFFGLYIAAVTNLARHETRERAPVLARCLPLLALVPVCRVGSVYASMSPEKGWALRLFVVVFAAGAWLVFRMFRRPAPPLPPLIGAHIRLLLPLQAAICWVADPYETGRICAIVLLLFWPLSKVVSRRFYAS